MKMNTVMDVDMGVDMNMNMNMNMDMDMVLFLGKIVDITYRTAPTVYRFSPISE
jgi:hypothetical protein